MGAIRFRLGRGVTAFALVGLLAIGGECWHQWQVWRGKRQP